MILAGDIGGTHTRLAFFYRGKMVGSESKFDSQKYGSLEEIITQFLGNTGVEKGCFGVAGPVRNGRCKATNLPWMIDSEKMRGAAKIPKIHLLNDLEATAYGLRVLKEEELVVLHQGKVQKGNQALIAAGTGLGEAGLIWDGKEHRPFACEGGHVDFAPRSELEIELLRYLEKKFGHVSYERVVSGPGLKSLYEFLIETGKEEGSAKVEEAMKREDPAKVISQWGAQNRDKGCVRAVDWFLSLYGAEGGNMALKFLSLGGFFIGGGIAPHLAERMKNGAFHQAFVNKGRFKELLETIPIWIVMNDNAGLLGAAYYAEKM